MFNLRHSSLRNAVERIFGVLKKRFRVLTHQLEYSFEIQVRLMMVICCLHNIVRLVSGDDWFDEEWEREHSNTGSQESLVRKTGDPVVRKEITRREARQARNLRDSIAEQMWSQYSKLKRRDRLE